MAIPVKLPKEVLNLFPTWEYRCPDCGTYVESNISFCPNCKTPFDENRWRVPPRFLRSHEAMSEYAHKVLAPKLTQKQRELLFHYFTEFLNSGWEDSGGTDVTDDGKWDGSIGSPYVTSQTSYHGTYCLETSGSATQDVVYKTHTAIATAFQRFYVKWSTIPPAWKWVRFVEIWGGGNLIAKLELRTESGDPYLRLDVDIPDANYDYTWSDVTADTWYCIEVKEVMGEASNGEYCVWIDGNLVINQTGLNTSGQSTVNYLKLGLRWSSYTVTQNFDCVIVADTYIGPETTEQTYTKTWATDALFKKLGIPKALSVDAAFQKQDIPKTFGLDAALQKSVILQKQVDALFKRFDILKSFAVDVRFGALMTQTISRQIDVLLKKLDASKTFGLDAYFGPVEAQAYAKTFALDVIFAYKVRLPELWLDENGKLVLNISKPQTWVGT